MTNSIIFFINPYFSEDIGVTNVYFKDPYSAREYLRNHSRVQEILYIEDITFNKFMEKYIKIESMSLWEL